MDSSIQIIGDTKAPLGHLRNGTWCAGAIKMVQFPWAPANPPEKPTKDVCYSRVYFQARLLLPTGIEEEGGRNLTSHCITSATPVSLTR